MNLKKKQRMTSLQKKFGTLGAALALINANGSPEQNRTYCSKEGGHDFFEVGNINIMGQAKKSTLADVTQKVIAKRKLSEIAAEDPEIWIKHYRGIQSLSFTLDEQPAEREMEVCLLFGDSNTGKSTKARMYANLYGEYYTVPIPNNKALWFDGYGGEKSIIIEEFKGWISPTALNTYLDKYKCTLPIKGSTVTAKYEHVFITSNYPPEEWWSDKVVWNRTALFRRLTSIYEFRGTDHVDCIIKKLK